VFLINLFFIFLLNITSCFAKESIDPFSKIIVKSDSALFSKDKKDSSLFNLKYKGNVRVSFADSTKITSENLKIFVRTKNSKNDIEKIVLEKDVKLNRENRKVQADKVELLVPLSLCKVNGNVKIEQMQNGEKDIPVSTECESAQFRWDKEEIELTGNEEKPVSTTIELGGKLKIFKK